MLALIGTCVGVKILTIYVYLKQTEEYGDIKNVNELFQEKVNDILKLGALGKDSRIHRIMKRYLSTI